MNGVLKKDKGLELEDVGTRRCSPGVGQKGRRKEEEENEEEKKGKKMNLGLD